MHIVTIPVTPFEQNARVVYDPESREAMVVDPGGEVPKITSIIVEKDLVVKSVFVTHAHIDHAGGVAELVENLRDIDESSEPPQFCIHALEMEAGARISEQASLFEFPPGRYRNIPKPDVYLEHGGKITLSGFVGRVLFAPGHSPGHVLLYFSDVEYALEDEGASGSCRTSVRVSTGPLLICGDVLFRGSVGRSDLPGGNHELLIRSIEENILTLPDETLVLSGHGPDTTVGRERASNPYL